MGLPVDQRSVAARANVRNRANENLQPLRLKVLSNYPESLKNDPLMLPLMPHCVTSIDSRFTRSMSRSLAIIADAWFSGEPHEPAVICTTARRRPRVEIRQARARPPDTRIPEQARPRDGERRRRARPACSPSDLLRQLRLALVCSRIL